jgi:hypothetical protein
VKRRKMPEIQVINVDRGGNGRHGDGTWPETDGRGCPRCGAIRGGGHGGDCPNGYMTFDEDGNYGPVCVCSCDRCGPVNAHDCRRVACGFSGDRHVY